MKQPVKRFLKTNTLKLQNPKSMLESYTKFPRFANEADRTAHAATIFRLKRYEHRNREPVSKQRRRGVARTFSGVVLPALKARCCQ